MGNLPRAENLNFVNGEINVTLQVENVSGSVVIRLSGDFDASAVSEVRPELEEILEPGNGKVVFSFDELKFIDSTGIGFVVYAFKRLKSGGGRLRIAGAKGQPAELISVLKVDQVIEMFDDETGACK